MRAGKAAGRYAQALLDLSLEQNQLDAVMNDMVVVSQACAENRDLELMLQSPIIKADKKRAVMEGVFATAISELSMSFIRLITDKGREGMLLGISTSFLALYKEHKGIVQAAITSAVALTQEQRESLKKSLAGLGNEVEITESVEPSILGGLKITVGDQRIDASVQRKLNDLKIDLSK
ncbi:MAG: ATP synthase F1 subunit delta [Flavobacteriales bacterium]|jgi:F-type H+-transporting ATPase subunit delta|nr:ATP synthase F1 subunit delta [Flavobacteriales bacterium]NCG31228.1 ATP synthase F1 subunit delta [Bacteroidota bacterium]MBT3964704.1 ATP synthase F1 subunit delta [Flavobacteriales bacterium]MBT4706136.1 ATP synthase F1 subunit delta [Flavobacteriales bacterium]MBT4930617.1 ATP synthase F1 subunit delta [Flavobacteriales bacterium]